MDLLSHILDLASSSQYCTFVIVPSSPPFPVSLLPLLSPSTLGERALYLVPPTSITCHPGHHRLLSRTIHPSIVNIDSSTLSSLSIRHRRPSCFSLPSPSRERDGPFLSCVCVRARCRVCVCPPGHTARSARGRRRTRRPGTVHRTCTGTRYLVPDSKQKDANLDRSFAPKAVRSPSRCIFVVVNYSSRRVASLVHFAQRPCFWRSSTRVFAPSPIAVIIVRIRRSSGPASRFVVATPWRAKAASKYIVDCTLDGHQARHRRDGFNRECRLHTTITHRCTKVTQALRRHQRRPLHLISPDIHYCQPRRAARDDPVSAYLGRSADHHLQSTPTTAHAPLHITHIHIHSPRWLPNNDVVFVVMFTLPLVFCRCLGACLVESWTDLGPCRCSR